jgi:ubiquinone/menaquinone biosynthesis C-methylase UbiE
MITPFCVSAGGHGGGEDKAKESVSLLAKERAKEIIQILREGNFSHSGGVEAINILNSKVITLAPYIQEVNSLEIGCGTGAASYFMQKEGYNNLWAIDINEKAIEEAKIQYPSVNFQVADVTKLTKIFEDDFFEFIYSFNVTHAMKDKVPMLQRLKAISKRGTTLAIFDYYLKDEHSTDAIKNLSGNDMFPIKLSKFKMMMKILGWEIIEEVEVTDKYKFWHKAMLAKIEARIDMLKGKNYTDDEIKLVVERFQHLLDAIESERLGGIILIAKKI